MEKSVSGVSKTKRSLGIDIQLVHFYYISLFEKIAINLGYSNNN